MKVPKEVGNFADLKKTPEGEKLFNDLYEFFSEEASLIRLKTASYLQRPALEALQPALEERFGEELKRLREPKNHGELRRLKQAMGRMVRLIMVGPDAGKGEYIVEKTGVRIRVGEIFTTAARYKLNKNKQGEEDE